MSASASAAPMHPICAVCKKPVEELIWYDDDGVDAFWFQERVVIVRCHGREERVRIPIREFVAADQVHVVEAFRDEAAVLRLPEGGT
jgi:hypothetical protein